MLSFTCTHLTVHAPSQAAVKEAPKPLSREEIARMRQEADPNFKKRKESKEKPVAPPVRAPGSGTAVRSNRIDR